MGDADEKDKVSRRRMSVPFGDGALRVDLSEPFTVEDEDGRDEWVCLAKLLGREKPLRWLGSEPPPPVSDNDITHTMFLSQGRGDTPEAAIKDAMAQIERAHLADPLIRRKPSEKPLAATSRQATVPPARARAPKKPGSAAAAIATQTAAVAPGSWDDVTETAARQKVPEPPKPVRWLSRLWRKKA